MWLFKSHCGVSNGKECHHFRTHVDIVQPTPMAAHPGSLTDGFAEATVLFLGHDCNVWLMFFNWGRNV